MTTTVIDAPHAPFIFYEVAPVFGHLNGVINVTLSAVCTRVSEDGNPKSDLTVVAYLRGNIHAALGLRDALNQALLMATPTAEGKAN